MTLDNLEHQNRGFYGLFWQFRAARRILRANYVKISWDRQGQAACEIFSIECRFRQSSSRFSRFKETHAWGHQRVVPS